MIPKEIVGEYGLMSPMITLKRYLVPSREVLSTVPRLRAGFISYRHLSAVAELPTKDVDS